MALPKKRQSSTRGKKRRTHWKATIPSLTKCKKCGSLNLPHSVCRNCGFYKDKEVIKVKEEK